MNDMRKLMEAAEELDTPVEEATKFSDRRVSRAREEIATLLGMIDEHLYDAQLPSGVERKYMDFVEMIDNLLEADSAKNAKDDWGDDDSWDAKE